MPEQLHKDFREFLTCLVDHEVTFMIIGGYAVAWHGQSRNTEDLDIWINPESGNISRTMEAMNDFFGDGFIEMPVERFLETKVKQIGAPPWRIDLLVRVDGLEFQEAYPNHEKWQIGDHAYPIISLPDLRTAKKAAGRPKDLADLHDFLPPEN